MKGNFECLIKYFNIDCNHGLAYVNVATQYNLQHIPHHTDKMGSKKVKKKRLLLWNRDQGHNSDQA